MMNKEGKKLRKKQRTSQVSEDYDCHQTIIIKTTTDLHIRHLWRQLFTSRLV